MCERVRAVEQRTQGEREMIDAVAKAEREREGREEVRETGNERDDVRTIPHARKKV